MSGTELGALVSGLALLVGAFFTGLIGLRNAPRGTSKERRLIEQYDTWRPRVRRVVADLRDLLATHRIPEPPGIDDDLRFPPSEVAKDE
jgi:hypothetical protein